MARHAHATRRGSRAPPGYVHAPEHQRGSVRRAIIAIVASLLPLTVAVWGAQAPGDLNRARDLLGSRDLKSVVLEFEYVLGTGRRPAAASRGKFRGRGKVTYQYPRSYKIEMFREFPGGISTQVSVDDGTTYARWWSRGGRTERVDFDAASLAAARKRLQREVMIRLAGLLLADAPFLTYEPRPGGYAVASERGSSIELSLDHDRVTMVRYERLRPIAPSFTADGRPALPPEQLEPAEGFVGDFRANGPNRRPHLFQSRYETGWEDVVVTGYVVNPSLPANTFRPPPDRRGR